MRRFLLVSGSCDGFNVISVLQIFSVLKSRLIGALRHDNAAVRTPVSRPSSLLRSWLFWSSEDPVDVSLKSLLSLAVGFVEAQYSMYGIIRTADSPVASVDAVNIVAVRFLLCCQSFFALVLFPFF